MALSRTATLGSIAGLTVLTYAMVSIQSTGLVEVRQPIYSTDPNFWQSQTARCQVYPSSIRDTTESPMVHCFYFKPGEMVYLDWSWHKVKQSTAGPADERGTVSFIFETLYADNRCDDNSQYSCWNPYLDWDEAKKTGTTHYLTATGADSKRVAKTSVNVYGLMP